MRKMTYWQRGALESQYGVYGIRGLEVPASVIENILLCDYEYPTERNVVECLEEEIRERLWLLSIAEHSIPGVVTDKEEAKP